MKFLIVLCAVAACALAIPSEDREEFKNKLKEYKRACIEESGTTEEVAKKLHNGDLSVRDEPAQCFIECLYKRIGFLNDKAEFLPEAMIEKLKKKAEVKTGDLDELINRCVKEKGEGKCETAFKVFECYRPHIEFKGEKHQ